MKTAELPRLLQQSGRFERAQFGSPGATLCRCALSNPFKQMTFNRSQLFEVSTMRFPKSAISLMYMAFLTLAFMPFPALAQETLPPPCCDKEPPPGDKSAVGVETQNQVVMADSALLAMGISRSQFLDRLAAGLFPGQEITLIYTVTTTVSVPADPSPIDKTPVLVQITYQYRIPRSQMKPEEIDALGQFVITDGVTYIQIKFTQTQPVIPPQ